MKELALTIGDKPFPTPKSVGHVLDIAGSFGGNILTFGLRALLVAAIVIALFSLVWGGIEWTMSEGDKQKVESARGRILYSIIGLFVSFFAIAIVLLITNLFAVPLITP